MEKYENAINNAFYYVIDKIVSLQSFFIDQAMVIGRTVFLIALLSAALNYALTGSGLKESMIKIGKATAFFLIVIAAYPHIIGFITSWTFSMAEKSIYPSIEKYYAGNKTRVEEKMQGGIFNENPGGRNGEYVQAIITETTADTMDPKAYFGDLYQTRTLDNMSYSTVAPAAVLKLVLLIAANCFDFVDQQNIWQNLGNIFKGSICAFFVILTGVFALLEYLMAFLEFMLVASIGVILFPLSIWEGSKFLSEKFIGAILGFFIKLLFCNIAIFLLLYGFTSLSYRFTAHSFTGSVDEILFIIFSCLLFFYICKSAPALAQSLLTGTPSLSAAGAISAATGAVAAAGATMGLAKKGGGLLAGGIAKTAFGAHNMLTEANAAKNAAAESGGDAKTRRGAFWNSVAGSAKDSVKAGSLNLARSLLGGEKSGNPHSWREHFLQQRNKDTGESQSFGELRAGLKKEGAERGRQYVAARTPPSVPATTAS